MNYPTHEILMYTPDVFDGSAKAEVIVYLEKEITVNADLIIEWDWRGDDVVVEHWRAENFYTEYDSFDKLKALRYLKKNICEVELGDMILNSVKS